MLRTPDHTRSMFLASALTLGFLLGPAAGHAQGIVAAITPATLSVTPGTEFDLELRVTQSGSAFNGFDAIVTYDPAALTFIPLSPSSTQQGTLMTGACGNTFHRFASGAGADTMTSVLLCANQSLAGPGTLYRLHFKASSTAQGTSVRIAPGKLRFYNAGLYVTPVSSTDAVIGIGQPVTGVVGGEAARGPALVVAPNPGRGHIAFTSSWKSTGSESLLVHDVQGRVVRSLTVTAGHTAWDGLTSDGAAAPEGIYFATLFTDRRSTTIRFSLVR